MQIRQHVLDFFALVELQPVDHLIGHALIAQREFQAARQRVDAIEDREVARTAPAGADLFGDVGRDRLRLALLRGIGRQPHALPFVVLGKQALLLSPLVVGDQRVGNAQDAFGAAVVLFELDDFDFGVVLFEIQDVAEIGAAPAVDRLIGIARDSQVRMIDRQRADDRVLRQIRILVFVDQDVAIALVQRRARLGILPQE